MHPASNLHLLPGNVHLPNGVKYPSSLEHTILRQKVHWLGIRSSGFQSLSLDSRAFDLFVILIAEGDRPFCPGNASFPVDFRFVSIECVPLRTNLVWVGFSVPNSFSDLKLSLEPFRRASFLGLGCSCLESVSRA